jgi:hypothetical protein
MFVESPVMVSVAFVASDVVVVRTDSCVL